MLLFDQMYTSVVYIFFSLSEGEEKQPYTIELGKNKLLEVVEKELAGMCIGDHRRITVPPHLAFGNKTIEFPDGVYSHLEDIYSCLFSYYQLIMSIFKKTLVGILSNYTMNNTFSTHSKQM